MTNLFRPNKEIIEAPFSRFVVVEVLSKTYHEREKIAEWSQSVNNVKFFIQTTGEDGENLESYLIAPRNSLIAKKIDGGESRSEGNLVVMYPFFSSHFSLPVKPGEQVWGMEEVDGKVFWVSRIHEPDTVEDLNYTHGDRRDIPTIQETNEVKEESPDNLVIERAPSFPNGFKLTNRASDLLDPEATDLEKLNEAGVNEDYFTLPDLDGYEKIVSENSESDSIIFEPVPRHTKRPGDLTLHGSNNASITLGTERGFGANVRPEDAEGSNLTPENDDASLVGLSEGMGAIDIVVGRGRLHEGSEANSDVDPIGTRPRVIENSRENFETDKNVGLDSSKAPEGSALADVNEGDPDFINDASRVYISMFSDPDNLFGLSYPDQPTEGTVVEPTPGDSAIVFKSDQIRIVARKDDDNGINGSIRIIKEGESEADRATIVIQPDGSIMIDGPKIIIGDGREDASGENGAGTQVVLGRGASESILLGDKLITMLKSLEEKFNNHIHNTGAGPSSNHVAGGATEMSAEDWDTAKSKVGKTK
jgi:hypothetical protein